jgi:DNA-binding response OmpR family regulator
MVALVVEDDASVRLLLDAILQTQGWERVLGASWGNAAVRASADWVDLLIVDHRLPGASGVDIVAEVKGGRPDLRVVMLTGDPDVRDRAEHVGVDRFLLKPFDVAELIEVLRTCERATVEAIDLRPAHGPAAEVRSVETPWFTGS